jgi:glycine oxidase
VLEIVDGSGRVQKLVTACGEFSSQNYIVAAGAWSRKVLGSHALQLDIKPMRGQILLYKFDAPPLEHVVLQKDLYLIPRRDGHLLVGSTLEDVGFDKRTTDTAREELQRRARALLPQLRNMEPVRQWAGLRPASPHNIPTIGRHPELQNLYLNSGHFRYGVTMAPASVEILLNELTGAPQLFDVAPYRAGWGVR